MEYRGVYSNMFVGSLFMSVIFIYILYMEQKVT